MSSVNRNGEILRGLPMPAPDMALSAIERERRAQAMVAQIDALTRQVANLTEQANAFAHAFLGAERDIRGVIARVNEIEAARPRTFLARLRWLVRG